LKTKRKEQRRHNSTYKKLAVQCLNEALCFVSSFVVAESFVLRNRQLLVAAKRCALCYGDSANFEVTGRNEQKTDNNTNQKLIFTI